MAKHNEKEETRAKPQSEPVDNKATLIASSEEDNDEATMMEKEREAVTCDVLCSLSSSAPHFGSAQEKQGAGKKSECAGNTCPKQLQLPMFLSKVSRALQHAGRQYPQ